jgi:hypothetical protein
MRLRGTAAESVVFHFKNYMSGEEHGDGTSLRYTSLDPAFRDAVITMEGFSNRALGYIRKALHIATATPIMMKMKLGEQGFELSVADRESFEAFMQQLKQVAVRDFEAAHYMVHVRVVKPSSRPPPEKARVRPHEAAFKKLTEMCYGSAHGGAMGTWTRECDVLMAERDFLKTFHQQRQLVQRAMGDGRYLLNPTTALCPFDGCHHARHRLNAMSYYQFLFSTVNGRRCHWRPAAPSLLSPRPKPHESNPAIPIVIKRFEVLAKQPNISNEDLDAQAGTVQLTKEWMEAQPHTSGAGEIEAIREFDEEGRAFSEMTDLFDPGDISTNLLRAQWVARVKATHPTPEADPEA